MLNYSSGLITLICLSVRRTSGHVSGVSAVGMSIWSRTANFGERQLFLLKNDHSSCYSREMAALQERPLLQLLQREQQSARIHFRLRAHVRPSVKNVDTLRGALYERNQTAQATIKPNKQPSRLKKCAQPLMHHNAQTCFSIHTH